MLKALAGEVTTATVPAEVQGVEQDIDLTGIEKVNRFPHGLSQRR